jgi:hypothetical protein
VSLGQFFADLEIRPTRLVCASARPQLLSTRSPVSLEALGPLHGAGTLEPVMLPLAPGGHSGIWPPLHSAHGCVPAISQCGILCVIVSWCQTWASPHSLFGPGWRQIPRLFAPHRLAAPRVDPSRRCASDGTRAQDCRGTAGERSRNS